MSNFRRASVLAVVAAASVLMTAACSTTTSDPPAAGTSSALSAEASPDVVISVRIAGGTVTPTNAHAEAEVGQPIVVKVDSDADDELHVHSDPSQSFEVEPRQGQEFRFVVSVPGKVDIELHHAGKTVTTLLIRP
ncbi:hypothetical protein ACIA8C_06030 [Nocardia sp. NPDC051321]|uniref:hypothetical protein n=1 Tax=Nocardia sp. NPDC051321 TaxID=3364323 RepID=UPI00378A84AF